MKAKLTLTTSLFLLLHMPGSAQFIGTGNRWATGAAMGCGSSNISYFFTSEWRPVNIGFTPFVNLNCVYRFQPDDRKYKIALINNWYFNGQFYYSPRQKYHFKSQWHHVTDMQEIYYLYRARFITFTACLGREFKVNPFVRPYFAVFTGVNSAHAHTQWTNADGNPFSDTAAGDQQMRNLIFGIEPGVLLLDNRRIQLDVAARLVFDKVSGSNLGPSVISRSHYLFDAKIGLRYRF